MSRTKKDILNTEAMLTRLASLLLEHANRQPDEYWNGRARTDAESLRRISMTLRRWHELECGDGNSYGSWTIARGNKKRQWAIHHANNSPCWWDGEMWVSIERRKTFDGKPCIPGAGKPDHVLEFAKAVRIESEFIHDDDGTAFIEHHHYMHGRGKNSVSYTRLPDREAGARKRLAKILKRYPALSAYVQGDPRGCALYILKPGDVRKGHDVSSCYTNGLAVYQ